MTIRDIFDSDPTPKHEYRRRLRSLQQSEHAAQAATEQIKRELEAALQSQQVLADQLSGAEGQLAATHRATESITSKLVELDRRLYTLHAAVDEVIPAYLKPYPRYEAGEPPLPKKHSSEELQMLAVMRGIDSRLDRIRLAVRVTTNVVSGALTTSAESAVPPSTQEPGADQTEAVPAKPDLANDEGRVLTQLELETSRTRSELIVLTDRLAERARQLGALDQLQNKIDGLHRELGSVKSDRETAEAELQAAQKLLRIRQIRIDFLEKKVAEGKASMVPGELPITHAHFFKIGRYFSSRPVLNWLASCNPRAAIEFFGGRARLIGDGPWQTAVLRDAMGNAGIAEGVKSNASDLPQAWIVGTEVPSFSSLVVEARNGVSDVYIYTQEEWLLLLATGFDPTEQEQASELQPDNHPVTRGLAKLDDGRIIHSALARNCDDPSFAGGNSPLSHFGYAVGREGLANSRRRQILTRVLTERLPDECFEGRKMSYRSLWGAPRSPQRLRKVAVHLNWLVKLHSPSPEKRLSVEEWKEDLQWLRDTHFHGSLRTFSWPADDDE